MIILDQNTSLQVFLASAVATTQSAVFTSYHDFISAGDSLSAQVATTNSSTAVTICVSPATSNYRFVKNIELHNSDTASITATFRTVSPSVTANLFRSILAIGDNLTYEDGLGWENVDKNGMKKSIASYNGYRLMKTPTYLSTAGTSTYLIPPGCTAIEIELIGGGGAGGGTSTVAGKSSGAGGAGGYLKKFIVNPQTTAISYTVAAQAIGSANANGSNGNDTTFTCNSVTYTAKGGSGGSISNAAPPSVNAGGAGGITAINGDINGSGDAGEFGIIVAALVNQGTSALGGEVLKYGTAGKSTTNSSATQSTGFGAGGSGIVLTTTSSALAGGSGRQGLIVIHEYTS